jgi:hypothetical protein
LSVPLGALLYDWQFVIAALLCIAVLVGLVFLFRSPE